MRAVHGLSGSSHTNGSTGHRRLLAALRGLSGSRLLPITHTFDRFLGLTGATRRCRDVSPGNRTTDGPRIVTHALHGLGGRPRLDRSAVGGTIRSLSLRLILATRPARVAHHALVRGVIRIGTYLGRLSGGSVTSCRRGRLVHHLHRLVTRS